MTAAHSVDGEVSTNSRLFWASLVSLVATAFSFMLRMLLLGDWQKEFGLSETEKGEILGAGLWPFAVSIILFSFIIDRVGYGKAFAFAFICHVGFAVITMNADGYGMLYWGSVVGALGNGTIEAAINPLIASIYKKDKIKWLNILHAGWPGGLVVTGVLALLLPVEMDWRHKIALIFIPTVAYGVMLLGARFPIHERVAAGVSDREMAREMGWGGAFIVAFMMVSELSSQFGLEDQTTRWAIILGITVGFGAWVRSFGRPLFVFLLFIMILLATTELGTDSWIKELMGPSMKTAFGLDAGWVLVYTAFLMMMLRTFCGPIVERLSPLGILAGSSAFAAVGIFALGYVEAAGAIFVVATIYGIGQTFFWPTTLGVVSEQFPRGGAITINVIAGIGMLGVGVLGNPWLGNVQDNEIADRLKADHPELATTYVTEKKKSVFGDYTALNQKKLDEKTTPEAHKKDITDARNAAKKSAFVKVSALPVIMLILYVGLIFWFRSRGGYRPVELEAEGGKS